VEVCDAVPVTSEATGHRNEELPQLSALDALPLGVIATDLSGHVYYVNDAAQRMYGYSRTDSIDASVVDLLVRPTDQQEALNILATVVSGQVWTGDFAVPRADGTTVQVHVDDVPLWRDGRVVGILGVSSEISDKEEATSIQLLAGITAEIAGAGDASTVAHLVVDRAADAFGADTASLSLLEGDGLLRLLALRGGTADARQRFATYPIDTQSPVGEAVSTGKIVTVTGSGDFHRRYPGIPTLRGERSLIAAPLVIGDRRLGGISLSFEGVRPFGPNEVVFLQTLADTTAQALARLDAAADAAARASKLAVLAEAAVELASSLDYQTTLTNVARLALSQLADWVGVELLDGDELRPVVTMHREPRMIELAAELRRRYPVPPDAPTGVPAVVRTGVSQLFETVSDDALVAGALNAEHLELIRQLRLKSLMVVPLAARDRILGALVLASSEPDRRYDREDLAFAEDLARRAAVAIDNSQLYSQTLESSVRLQHALLPESLPAPADWQVAVHYRPAGRTEVGGDFYDAIALADGRLLTVIGDVMGRGINAAAAMAQLRAALRAYVAVDPDPGCVLTKLTEMFAFYETSGLATLVIALADADRSSVTLASAGHLPVVVIRGGTPEIVAPPSSPPLCVGSFPRASMTVPIEPGDAFLLYTDGLVESREQDIDEGIGRLVRKLRAGAPVATDEDLSALAGELVPSGQDDDVTLLAVCRREPTATSR
jgi:PAS domain S-box-containing protein